VPTLPPQTVQAYEAAIARWNASPHGTAFPEWDRPVRRRQLERLLEHVAAGELVVDVGTGSGIVASSLLESDRRVLTIDVPGGNAAVAGWIEAHGGRTAVSVVGPQPIPLADGEAAAVLLADVIEHLPGSPLPLLGEIRRVLRPHGVLVLTTPNAVRLHARIKLLLGRSVWPPLAVVYDHDGVHPSDHREYTAADLRDALARAGFEVLDVEFVEERLASRRWKLLGRLAGRMLAAVRPPLCGDIVVVARVPLANASSA